MFHIKYSRFSLILFHALMSSMKCNIFTLFNKARIKSNHSIFRNISKSEINDENFTLRLPRGKSKNNSRCKRYSYHMILEIFSFIVLNYYLRKRLV